MNITKAASEQLQEAEVVRALRETSFNRESRHRDLLSAVAEQRIARANFVSRLVEEVAQVSPPHLLAELRRDGLLWSVVAEAVGVSDTAVRKWRRGQPIETQHRDRLSLLTALARYYGEYALPGSAVGFAEWLDSKIVHRFSATPLDLFKLHRSDDLPELHELLDWMLEPRKGGQGEALLDHYLGVAWRDEAKEEQRFRIVTDASGERILVIDQ